MEPPRNLISQLTEHIKKNLAKGYTSDALKFSLMGQGYSRISVEKAIELANLQLAASAPVMREKPEIIYRTEPEIIPEKESFFQKIKSWFR